MTTPRLDIDLNKIYHNAYELVKRLAERGISVTGVTKASLGSIEVANILLQAGVVSLGDSRIENIKAMRMSGSDACMMLIRSPMLSQVRQVVKSVNVSCNTEVAVIKALSVEACKQGCTHQILLMVELGDLREGIMPDDLIDTVREVIGLPNILLKGIGANLACRSGVPPNEKNMAKLSELVEQVEKSFGITLDIVSGGNSANIQWALNASKADIKRVNHLRLGESILLGCEPLQRQPIEGLHGDAFTLIAEVIESKLKPSKPTGDVAQTAFGEVSLLTGQAVNDRGMVKQSILAIGLQDIDYTGLQAPKGIAIMGASSDHLIVESIDDALKIGDEVSFQLNYSALLRAMTSPFVTKCYYPF